MTLGEWHARRPGGAPAVLMRRLDGGVRFSPGALLEAAEAERDACRDGRAGDREAAFALLAADSHVTDACLAALREGGGGQELRAIAARVAAAWGGGERGP